MRRRLLWSVVMAMLSPATLAKDRLLELNQATQAQLESLSGVGPELAERLLKVRSVKAFESWADLRRRVSGIGAKQAKKLSDQGLRIQGQALPG
ncbi:ComEA family DNA-binding protein [Paucibacter sp. JuS9]|uniref:ComEA family DNA-binding protein n=1 Tax=Roseateles TaxID=93681 RepID=UPI002FE5BCEE